MLALTPQDAWRLEQLMENDWEVTRQDEITIQWVNLVNTPAKHLRAQ